MPKRNRKLWRDEKTREPKWHSDIPVTIEERTRPDKYGRWLVMQGGKSIAASSTLDAALLWIESRGLKLLTLEDFDEPPEQTGPFMGILCPWCRKITYMQRTHCHLCGQEIIPF